MIRNIAFSLFALIFTAGCNQQADVDPEVEAKLKLLERMELQFETEMAQWAEDLNCNGANSLCTLSLSSTQGPEVGALEFRDLRPNSTLRGAERFGLRKTREVFAAADRLGCGQQACKVSTIFNSGAIDMNVPGLVIYSGSSSKAAVCILGSQGLNCE